MIAFVALHGSDRSLYSATSWKRICLPQQADTDMLGNPDWSATTAVLCLPATDDGVHGKVAMAELKIAIIAGSTRPGRHARYVAEWVVGQAVGRPDVRYDIVDLADRPLPLYDEAIPLVTRSIRTSTPRLGRRRSRLTTDSSSSAPSTTIRHPQHSKLPSTTYMPSGRTRLPHSLPTARCPGRAPSSTCV